MSLTLGFIYKETMHSRANRIAPQQQFDRPLRRLALVVVAPPANRVSQRSEDPKGEPDDEHDDTNRPEDGDASDESNQEENKSKNNHENSKVR